MIKEYNDYRLSNPNGISRGITQYLPSRFNNEQLGAVDQYPARRVKQQVFTAQTYDWHPQEDREDEDGDSKSREKAPEEAPDADMGADALSGSESALVGVQSAAASVAAVALAAVVYVSSLFVGISSYSATMDTLSFTASIRNPDNIPLQAALTSDAGSVTRELGNSAYLFFDGLEKGTEYALSIVNAETGETLYRKNYVTASEDPVHTAVENAELAPDGTFSFDLSVEGLRENEFYTITVMDENGNVLFVVDGREDIASFSFQTGQTWDGEGTPPSMPIVSVSVNGKTFMPPVQAESAPEGGTESEGAPPVENAADTPEELRPSANPDVVENPTEQPENLDAVENPTEQPENLDAAENPTEQAENPDAVENPTQQAATPDAAQTPTGQPATPDAAQTPTGQPATPNAAQTPTRQPATPNPAQTPTQQAATPNPAQTQTEQPATPNPAQTQTEQAENPDAVENPTEQPATPENPDPQTPFDASQLTWTWNDDHTAVTVERPDPNNPGNVIRTEAVITQSVQKEASCTEEGVRTYTASLEGPDGATYADTRTEVIPAKGHHYEQVSLEASDGSAEAEYVCADCGQIYRLSAAATEEEFP